MTRFASLHSEIVAAGGAIVAVAPAAPYQARHLAATSIPYPLLLDPDSRVTGRLRFRRRSLLAFLADLRAWRRWFAALLRHRRQGRITGHHSSVPGVAVVDAGGRVAWVHEGSGIGDYPPPEAVRAELDRLLPD